MSYPGSHNIFRQELANGITLLVYENFASQSFVHWRGGAGRRAGRNGRTGRTG
jgi:hypothetical protein